MKKYAVKIIIILLFISIISGCLEQNSYINKTKIIVGNNSNADFNTIQEAINSAKPGSTIIIENGTYNESIKIIKEIKLSGSNNSKILNNKNIKNFIEIYASNCILENIILINNNKSTNINGITVNKYNTIIRNITISGFYDGIRLINTGNVEINKSNKIFNNIIKNNENGIQAFKNTISEINNNSIENNRMYGIYLWAGSDKNKINNNIIKNNNIGFRTSSKENEIFINNISNNYENGIKVKGGQKNLIYYNTIYNNSVGIYFCCSAAENQIYKNNFIKNLISAREYYPVLNSNIFYHNLPVGGNYWDDYIKSNPEKDDNNDGIWDNSYLIEDHNNEDKFPYIKPLDFSN